jgi:hypothetical protein
MPGQKKIDEAFSFGTSKGDIHDWVSDCGFDPSDRLLSHEP